MHADHGGGSITYQWTLPGGTITAPTSLTFAVDQSSGAATLAYALSGRGSVAGAVRLHVISPLSA